MWDQIVDSLPTVVPIGLLVIFYRREVEEKKYWRNKALELLGLTENAIEAGKTLAKEPT